MLSFFIILILIGALIRGAHRGFLRQLIFSVGSLVVFFVAWHYNDPLSHSVAKVLDIFSRQNFMADQMTRAISFGLIFILGQLLRSWLARASKAITWIPVIRQTNALAGGLLNLILVYCVIFIFLWIGNFLPYDNIHQLIANSPVASWITQQTPLLTETFIHRIFGS